MTNLVNYVFGEVMIECDCYLWGLIGFLGYFFETLGVII